MSCPGILLPTDPPVTCKHYECLDKTTNPATTKCVAMEFVFARHYVRNGFIQKGAVGGYVSAVTVCLTGLTTTPISKAYAKPNVPYYGL
jgi:hypothetical protein